MDRKATGVVEAKPVGTTLSGVAEQSAKYLVGLAETVPHVALPFAYESTGTETYFRDGRDPEPRRRRVFAFHKPETLRAWFAEGTSLRARLSALPPVETSGLRDCQVKAFEMDFDPTGSARNHPDLFRNDDLGQTTHIASLRAKRRTLVIQRAAGRGCVVAEPEAALLATTIWAGHNVGQTARRNQPQHREKERPTGGDGLDSQTTGSERAKVQLSLQESRRYRLGKALRG